MDLIASKLNFSDLHDISSILFSGYEGRLLLNFCVALVIGILIGADREKKGKAAGVSTHSLVVCGSMLFTFVSGLMVGGDPTRIASQVVVGVGFLGGGIILKREGTKKVENLTTAASIWFSAAIGMTIGLNLYSLALISSFFAYVIFRWLPHYDHKDDTKEDKVNTGDQLAIEENDEET